MNKVIDLLHFSETSNLVQMYIFYSEIFILVFDYKKFFFSVWSINKVSFNRKYDSILPVVITRIITLP